MSELAAPEDWGHETRCGLVVGLLTCAAQNCDRLTHSFGVPFCGTCLDMLPPLVRRRFEEEWATWSMHEIEEPNRIERITKRGNKYTLEDGVRRRQAIDLEADLTRKRRLEIQTAWTLRGIRRSQDSRR